MLLLVIPSEVMLDAGCFLEKAQNVQMPQQLLCNLPAGMPGAVGVTLQAL